MPVHDPDVNPEEMLGSNLAYLEQQLPQINMILCCRAEDMIKRSEVVVVSQKRPAGSLAGRFKETPGTPQANDKT